MAKKPAKKKATAKRKSGRVTKRATGDKNTGLVTLAFKVKPTFHLKVTKAAAKADQYLGEYCQDALNAWMTKQDGSEATEAASESEGEAQEAA